MSNSLELNPNKEGAIEKVEKESSGIRKSQSAPEIITPEDLKTRVEDFNRKKEEALKRLNKIRAELGLPETDEQTFDIAEAERKLRILAEESGLSLEEAGFEMADKRDSSNISQQPDATSKIKPEVKDTENKETKPEGELEEKPSKLEPGDEIFYNGDFYNIYDIHMPTEEEKRTGITNSTNTLNTGTYNISKDALDKPIITAILKGSEIKVMLEEKNVLKVETPEQRAKIVRMQKSEDEAEQRAANFTGEGAKRKFVNMITGQPGKF